jgi:ABC-type transport system substrate-binding protein
MVFSTIAILAISGMAVGLFFLMKISEDPELILICGLDDAPNSIDPLKNPTPKYVNLMVIDQIAEGLFDYDQNKSNTPIVPNLALEGWWSLDELNYTCNLRRNVKFHDGMPFNATAVKWNFDRIYRFIPMYPADVWAWYYLYLNSEGKPYINRTVVIDEYTVRFVLNQPYVPLKHLLVLWNSYILSPASTPEDRFIDIETEKLIGTGPYILDSCELNYESEIIKTDLHANQEYWGGVPSIERVSFLALNHSQRFERMMSGELAYVPGEADDEILESYRNNSKIAVISKPRSGLWYLPMNNKLINVTMRKAISYAFNYTDFIETVHGEHAERVKSPLPKLIHYANWEAFQMPYYNISMARQILKNANWPNTSTLIANNNITSGNEWESLAESAWPLSIINFSAVSGTRQINTAIIVRKNLKQIGVKVNIINMTVVEWWSKMKNGVLEMYIAGWNAAFLDPVEIVNPLYSNGIDGEGNDFHFNDSLVQQWMEEAIEESNEIARELLYFNIQQRLIELNPMVWLDSEFNYHIWDSNVKGIPTEGAFIKFILKYAYYN